MSVILSVDIGTSKVCAIAFEAGAAEPLAVRSVANDADVEGLPAGRHEQDPARIADRCTEALRAVVSDSTVRGKDVAGIAISGQMHGVLLVDGGLRPVTNLITWRDRRTAGETWKLDNEQRTGCSMHPGYGGATLEWLAANGQVPAGTAALSMASFFAASMTGVAALEPTHAASWGICDIRDARAGRWDAETVRALSIPPDVLPPIRPSAEPLAGILPEPAGTLGLRSGIPVCSPVGDNQASFLGAAGLSADAAVVNLGTGGQISVPTPVFTVVAGLETRPLPGTGYILVGASLCGGWAYAYLRQFYQAVAHEFAAVDLDDDDVYARMNKLAAAAGETSGGLVADTRFSGTRGNPDVRGAIREIDAANLTPANLSRAFLEGIVRELAELARAAPFRGVKRIVASGNAVRRNPLLRAVIERRFGIECRMSEVEEEAAAGAALASARSLHRRI